LGPIGGDASSSTYFSSEFVRVLGGGSHLTN
jgi:hypothetical protein